MDGLDVNHAILSLAGMKSGAKVVDRTGMTPLNVNSATAILVGNAEKKAIFLSVKSMITMDYALIAVMVVKYISNVRGE